MSESHKIICVNGHYEAYDEATGKFVCSGDTYKECVDTLLEMLAEDARQELRREEPVAV